MKGLYDEMLLEQQKAREQQAGGVTAIYMQAQVPVVETAEVKSSTAEDKSKKRKYVEEEKIEDDEEQIQEPKARKSQHIEEVSEDNDEESYYASEEEKESDDESEESEDEVEEEYEYAVDSKGFQSLREEESEDEEDYDYDTEDEDEEESEEEDDEAEEPITYVDEDGTIYEEVVEEELPPFSWISSWLNYNVHHIEYERPDVVANIFNEYKEISRGDNLHKSHDVEYIALLPEDSVSKQMDIMFPELEDYSAMTAILGATLLWFDSN